MSWHGYKPKGTFFPWLWFVIRVSVENMHRRTAAEEAGGHCVRVTPPACACSLSHSPHSLSPAGTQPSMNHPGKRRKIEKRQAHHGQSRRQPRLGVLRKAFKRFYELKLWIMANKIKVIQMKMINTKRCPTVTIHFHRHYFIWMHSKVLSLSYSQRKKLKSRGLTWD